MKDFEGIDRMQPVSPFLHDYAPENGVGPECLQFSTAMGDISVTGEKISGGELMRKPETALVLQVQDIDGTGRKRVASTTTTPSVQPKSNKKKKTTTKKKQKSKKKKQLTVTSKASTKPTEPNYEGTADEEERSKHDNDGSNDESE
jgi:hypothetical protein